ncbi:diguanylate cyclase [Psychrosphaera sp. B3R10]|uniref:GGDEF domain-containing protein n=1 Tax=unclassified Psychrosphaera TaxID=2641570 RepID=UPI001C0991CE|nr:MULTISPECIES: diguanylate cyclase [unclassified Psychrosphaera]MBU2880591.1 diguanylate cyclase [Psychrosphaera sp. I2R16]MBU2990677.1 diguanylate cyclase [Psychrosphaera sp. B3R10]
MFNNPIFEIYQLSPLAYIWMGLIIGSMLFNGIIAIQKKSIVNGLQSGFLLSLMLMTLSLNLDNSLSLGSDTIAQVITIYASLALFAFNLITLYCYLSLGQDISPRITLLLKLSCSFTILTPLTTFIAPPSVFLLILTFVFLTSLLSYLLFAFENANIHFETPKTHYIPLSLLIVSVLYTVIFLAANLQSNLTPQTLWMFAIIYYVVENYWQQTTSNGSGPDEETVDQLNKTLADQNFEMQVTLRELKEKNHELEKLNTLDALSNIHNRRHFDKRILAELRRSRREQLPLSLVMFDIDHFKKVNDTYGHLIGDEVIRSVALTAAETLQRSTDEVFRYGGEEFALILPNTEKLGAFALAEKIRIKISQLAINSEKGPVSCNASFGVGFTDATHSMSPKDIIGQADDALYQAKETGRNRVIIFNSEENINATQ